MPMRTTTTSRDRRGVRETASSPRRRRRAGRGSPLPARDACSARFGGSLRRRRRRPNASLSPSVYVCIAHRVYQRVRSYEIADWPPVSFVSAAPQSLLLPASVHHGVHHQGGLPSPTHGGPSAAELSRQLQGLSLGGSTSPRPRAMPGSPASAGVSPPGRRPARSESTPPGASGPHAAHPRGPGVDRILEVRARTVGFTSPSCSPRGSPCCFCSPRSYTRASLAAPRAVAPALAPPHVASRCTRARPVRSLARWTS